MRFSVLGPISLHQETGASITPTPLKLRELLALLLLNANRVVVADHLIDQLWNSAPPRTAKAALQVYVSKLRSHLARYDEATAETLARTRLVTEPSGYSLHVRDHELDLARFESLRLRAQVTERAGDLRQGSLLLEQALDIWRGTAMADVTGLSALNTEAERLNETRICVREQHIAIELLLNRHREALPRLTELIAQHPLRETLHEHLMLAQYRCGRTAESLETYQRFRGVLVDEVGLEPGVRLRSLHHAILNRDPALERVLVS